MAGSRARAAACAADGGLADGLARGDRRGARAGDRALGSSARRATTTRARCCARSWACARCSGSSACARRATRGERARRRETRPAAAPGPARGGAGMTRRCAIVSASVPPMAMRPDQALREPQALQHRDEPLHHAQGHRRADRAGRRGARGRQRDRRGHHLGRALADPRRQRARAARGAAPLLRSDSTRRRIVLYGALRRSIEQHAGTSATAKNMRQSDPPPRGKRGTLARQARARNGPMVRGTIERVFKALDLHAAATSKRSTENLDASRLRSRSSTASTVRQSPQHSDPLRRAATDD